MKEEYLKPIQCSRCKSELTGLAKFTNAERTLTLCEDCIYSCLTFLIHDSTSNFNLIWNFIYEDKKK